MMEEKERKSWFEWSINVITLGLCIIGMFFIVFSFYWLIGSFVKWEWLTFKPRYIDPEHIRIAILLIFTISCIVEEITD